MLACMSELAPREMRRAWVTAFGNAKLDQREHLLLRDLPAPGQLEPPVIEKILTHLGLQARAPPRSPARGQALHAA